MKTAMASGNTYKDREVAVGLQLVRSEEAADAAADDDNIGIEGGRWGGGQNGHKQRK
jgi:hypothetical protein